MAKKLYAEVGGASQLVKKLYTEVGGVSHVVKKLYAEVGGVSKLVYALDDLFTFSFHQYYYNAISLNSYCRLDSWFCGYRENGLPGMDIVCWNATGYSGGEPVTKIDINFVNPDALVGKTITVNYAADFNDSKANNRIWYQWQQDNSEFSGGLVGGNGETIGIGKEIQRGMKNFQIAMRTGGDGNNGAHVTIQSISLDGQQVFP